VIVFVVSTLALVYFTFAQLQQLAGPRAIPSRPGVNDESVFTLHPEEHIFRQPTTIKRIFRVTSVSRRPDGVLKQVYLINDAFPGPTLEARSGDRLIIEVENALEDGEGLTIHWHGLSMRGENEMDGAAGITQDAIAPGETFTYDFSIEPHQHGTFWYHAHDGVQRADGLFGGLVVHAPSQAHSKSTVPAEKLLLVEDWYHRSAAQALDFYMHLGSFGNEPVPDSILLNGQGAFNCSDAVAARPLDCEQRSTDDISSLRLEGDRENVIRIVNVGAYSGISISVAGSSLAPLAVDGGTPVQRTQARTVGYIQPGERVDFLVQSLPDWQRDTHMEVSLDTTPFKMSNPALTTTHQFPVSWTHQSDLLANVSEVESERFDLEELKPELQQSSLMPREANHTIVLYTMTQKLSHLDNVPHGMINNTFWKPQDKPLNALHRDERDKSLLIPAIPFDSAHPLWVDIVVNNLDEEGHPFHLHGYDFWVLSKYSSTFNWGSYNPYLDASPPGGPYDLENALKKDTVWVPRRGYAVLRLKADNPG